MAKQKYMWGAWVQRENGLSEWARWDSWSGHAFGCRAFVDHENTAIKMAAYVATWDGIQSCTPVKVPIPEGPADE